MSALHIAQLIAAFTIGALFAELVIPMLNNYSAKRRVTRRMKVVADLLFEDWRIIDPDGYEFVLQDTGEQLEVVAQNNNHYVDKPNQGDDWLDWNTND